MKAFRFHSMDFIRWHPFACVKISIFSKWHFVHIEFHKSRNWNCIAVTFANRTVFYDKSENFAPTKFLGKKQIFVMPNDVEQLQICQFCLCEDQPSTLITSPCWCAHHVHKMCLEKWLNYKRQKTCDDCHYTFDVLPTLKYKFIESIEIWLGHPLIRTYFVAQFLLTAFLNTIATLLIGMARQQLTHLLCKGMNPFSNEYWHFGSFALALIPTTLLFVRCNTLFVQAQIMPWHRWWQSRIYYQVKLRK